LVDVSLLRRLKSFGAKVSGGWKLGPLGSRIMKLIDSFGEAKLLIKIFLAAWQLVELAAQIKG